MGKIIKFDEIVRQGNGTAREKMSYHPRDRDEGVSTEYDLAIRALQAYAVDAVRQAMAELPYSERVRLPANFEEIMRDPHGELPRKIRRKLMALPMKSKQKLIFAMVSAAHDGWVKENPYYFFDQRYTGERFLFLRIELCGIYVYKEFLGMIIEIVRRLELETPNLDWDAEGMYMHKRGEFVRERGLTNSNLAAYIARCNEEYAAMSPEIATALKQDPELAKELAKQVILRTPMGGIGYC